MSLTISTIRRFPVKRRARELRVPAGADSGKFRVPPEMVEKLCIAAQIQVPAAARPGFPRQAARRAVGTRPAHAVKLARLVMPRAAIRNGSRWT